MDIVKEGEESQKPIIPQRNHKKTIMEKNLDRAEEQGGEENEDGKKNQGERRGWQKVKKIKGGAKSITKKHGLVLAIAFKIHGWDLQQGGGQCLFRTIANCSRGVGGGESVTPQTRGGGGVYE